MNAENLMEILGALDKRVDELVGRLRQTTAERDQLKKQLEETTQRNEELELELMASSDDKSEIRQRIQTIIQKIESMETAQAQ
ncbi:MAG: hypothetical protein GC154_06040 [bacterium]|nr:hypothetical protein [bacterium]